jgi:hypothetical protein
LSKNNEIKKTRKKRKLKENFYPSGCVYKCGKHGYLTCEEVRLINGKPHDCKQCSIIRSMRRNGRNSHITELYCIECKQTKSQHLFHKCEINKIESRCRDCKKNIRNPCGKSSLTSREIYLKSRFKLNNEDCNYIIKNQNGRCDICNNYETKMSARTSYVQNLSVDHCHKSELNNKIVVRGLLCHNCNIMIGMANDNVNILISAANYLKMSY